MSAVGRCLAAIGMPMTSDRFQGQKDGQWSEQDFVDVLREVLPDLDPVLAKRQGLLRRLYRRPRAPESAHQQRVSNR